LKFPDILEFLNKTKDASIEAASKSFGTLKKLTGLEQEEEGHSMEDVVEKAEIPEAYSRRFTLHPIEDPAQVLSRDDQLILLQKAYENWKITNNSLLLVAESGAGMSSLLNASLSLYPEAKIIANNFNIPSTKKLMQLFKTSFKFDDITNLTEIADKLDDEPQVVIFENIERLFLRKVGGFNVLEDFLLLMHATKHKIYWIVTVNKYSLYYLDQTYNLSPNFLSIIHLPAFKMEYIKEVIMQRNKGYEIIYTKPKVPSRILLQRIKNSEKDKKQSILEEYFYSSMYQFSDGNISRSILFWKNSIIRVSGKRVYVCAYEPKPITDLSLDDLFILEAIFQHSSLSPEELRLVLRHSSKGSLISLANLMEKKLIYPKKYEEGQTEYQINLLQLKTLKNLLRDKLNRNIK